MNVAQDQPTRVFAAISQFLMLSDPPPHLCIGLSNISQRLTEHELLNRTFLIMCMAHGLDSAILDPLDQDLMNAMITASSTRIPTWRRQLPSPKARRGCAGTPACR